MKSYCTLPLWLIPSPYLLKNIDHFADSIVLPFLEFHAIE